MQLEETGEEEAIGAHTICPMIGGERTPFPILVLVVLLLPLYFVVRLAAAVFHLGQAVIRAWHFPARKFPDWTHA